MCYELVRHAIKKKCKLLNKLDTKVTRNLWYWCNH